MIKINLLGDETVIDTSGTWFLIAYVFSVVATVLCCALLYFSAASSIQDYTSQADDLDTQLRKLKETTQEVHELEKKKKDLADKTNVIAILKKNKLGPVRILDDLNTALPDRAWLTDLRETGGLMRISGYALDNQTIAAFMKALEFSNYFESIDLGESREVDKDGTKIKEFTLLTKVVYSGLQKKVEPGVSPAGSVTPSPSPALSAGSAPAAASAASVTATESPVPSVSPAASSASEAAVVSATPGNS
jgi:type IV pilus assembly protein PilN